MLLSFWPARWIESWDSTQPQKLNTVTNGYIQTAAITPARYPGTCKRFLSEALAKKDRISGEENMSHPLISLKELQPISMKVKLTFKARLFDCLQNNCFWTIEVIVVPTCSLMFVSRPSNVVNLPPNVPAWVTKSKDGICTSQVSDWK